MGISKQKLVFQHRGEYNCEESSKLSIKKQSAFSYKTGASSAVNVGKIQKQIHNFDAITNRRFPKTKKNFAPDHGDSFLEKITEIDNLTNYIPTDLNICIYLIRCLITVKSVIHTIVDTFWEEIKTHRKPEWTRKVKTAIEKENTRRLLEECHKTENGEERKKTFTKILGIYKGLSFEQPYQNQTFTIIWIVNFIQRLRQ